MCITIKTAENIVNNLIWKYISPSVQLIKIIYGKIHILHIKYFDVCVSIGLTTIGYTWTEYEMSQYNMVLVSWYPYWMNCP